jgi:DNA replicative helicase MCM subunit Mcm2 (Cdc46/Mcm family)
VWSGSSWKPFGTETSRGSSTVSDLSETSRLSEALAKSQAENIANLLDAEKIINQMQATIRKARKALKVDFDVPVDAVNYADRVISARKLLKEGLKTK